MTSEFLLKPISPSDISGRSISAKQAADKTTEDREESPKCVLRRQIKRKSTVTRNPESLNAKLTTQPTIDPFFAKLNTFSGDIMRSNRMLMNVLPQKENAGLSLNSPFWDKSDHVSSDSERLHIEVKRTKIPRKLQNTSLRSSLPDYKITNSSLDGFKFTS